MFAPDANVRKGLRVDSNIQANLEESKMLIIEVNDAQIQQALARAAQRVGDTGPLMLGIGQEMESRIRARFETETDPAGQAWAQLLPSTLETYPKDGNHRILDRTGDMINSLSHEADERQVRVGFGAVGGTAGDPYAVYHEYGTKKMARRGMLFADPEAGTLGEGDKEAILGLAVEYLRHAADGH
jgi:phage virion morphogenesis protein